MGRTFQDPVPAVRRVNSPEEKRSWIGPSHVTDGREYVSLATTIEETLKASPQYSLSRCIYRVPNHLRRINEQAYTPMLVSIGPLHRNNDQILPMEAHKLKYLQSFLGDPQANADLLNSCLGIVKGMETQIRECYADPIDLSSNDFSRMVLVDSVFIIELFRRKLSQREDDYIYKRPFLELIVLRDISLEENQLPFFILNKLYCAAFLTNSVPSFTKIVLEGFSVNLGANTNIDELNYLHLLHLLACHLMGTAITNNSRVEDKMILEDSVFPPATELHQAGVKFQVIKNSSSSLDIKFDKEKGILRMGKFEVGDNSEYLCRNLIALEQCHYRSDETRYFTDYHNFLNRLVNTPEDVQLLAEAGIIENWLGSPKQVSDLINSLDFYAYCSAGGSYYPEITEQINEHCKKRWNRYRATLIHTYFKHPWAIISVVYAVVLLLLTIIQVVTGIMQSTHN